MKIITPNYYQHFQCIADRCNHNCCIGWEIDIDEDTLKYYRGIEGELGARLKEKISTKETPHFILDSKERCPFLNSCNLCDIITELGEEGLCQICDDHPRFYNEWPQHTELGLGLCCEAAAALILDQKEKATLCFEPYNSFFTLREKVFNALQNRSASMEQRLVEMLDLCGSNHVPSPKEWVPFFKELERLDPQWDEKLEKTSNTFPVGWDQPLEQLAVYFTFRHLKPEQLAKRAAFIVLSVKMIASVFFAEEHSLENLIEIARLYSAEIEYSDENIQKILEHIT
ncbi:MAG: flagellin lysine-N-methylase [Clostridia bacterium]|nr:flagellin lysine-N-methylase [Clostridia bacterium]